MVVICELVASSSSYGFKWWRGGMISGSVSPLFRWNGCLRGLWLSISYPSISRSFNLEMAVEYDEPPFCFCGYGALDFPLRSYYLVVAWHVPWPYVTSGLVEGSLILVKTFQFPTYFEALLLNLQCFLCVFIFAKFQFIVFAYSEPPLGFIAMISTLIFSPF